MQPTEKKYLLVSDLDDTLLGNADALKRFYRYYESECAHFVDLVYASGRFPDSIREDIREKELPPPKYLIGGVGSEIRTYPGHQIVEAWKETIFSDWSAETVHRTLERVEGIELQPEWNQSAFKVSYWYPDATENDLARLRQRLREAGLEITIIYSSGEDLDVLPDGVDKGSAAEFVAHQLGYANQHVITAGNSENDAALLGRGFHGIVVGNAHQGLRELVNEHSAYQSSKDHAAGVEDGLRHWLNRLNDQNV